ncbi:MAG TPA: polysaccharide deacetylase family protein [Burkholderiaceae bacterium]|nr:polysaccharide deacetylase family protein [Burkholderiaceae bacterium]
MSMISRLVRGAGALVAPGGARARLSILIYHRVLAAPDPLLPDIIDAATFDAHMRALSEAFNVLPLAEAAERLYAGTLPPRAACITFDDGYRDNAEIACPILLKHRLSATFFVATGYLDGGRMFNDTVIESIRALNESELVLPNGTRLPIHDLAARRRAISPALRAVKYLPMQERLAWAQALAARVGTAMPNDLMMSSDQVRGLARDGMEIGGHTVAHPILAKLSTHEARREIESNRAALASLIGQPVTTFAYPNGVPHEDYHAEHVAMVEAAGYRTAVSTAWGVATQEADRLQLPRFTPWDRHPARFLVRLLHNAWTGAQPEHVARPAAMTAPAIA